MAKPNYNQSRRDFETLEAIAEVDDQVELDAGRLALMEEPTYSKAASMYQAGIRLWFGENPTEDWDGGHDDSTIREIAARHNIEV